MRLVQFLRSLGLAFPLFVFVLSLGGSRVLAAQVRVLVDVPAPGTDSLYWFPDGQHLLLINVFNPTPGTQRLRFLVFDITSQKVTPVSEEGELGTDGASTLCLANTGLGCYYLFSASGAVVRSSDPSLCTPAEGWRFDGLDLPYLMGTYAEFVMDRPRFNLVSNDGKHYLAELGTFTKLEPNLDLLPGTPYASFSVAAIAEHREGGGVVYRLPPEKYLAVFGQWLAGGGGRSLLALVVIPREEAERMPVTGGMEMNQKFRLLVLEVVP
ncbi:MAG TPA: hypothetical protein ENK37_11325 [Oceanithermus profundus]|uniref:Uncharacterized protein n=1 Tax=Oceanithermus profundus TaxID=187137 RepID=A0A7C4ZSH5_9DEIN|nr:hypothetical protein [Oceanithermus profundus]